MRQPRAADARPGVALHEEHGVRLHGPDAALGHALEVRLVAHRRLETVPVDGGVVAAVRARAHVAAERPRRVEVLVPAPAGLELDDLEAQREPRRLGAELRRRGRDFPRVGLDAPAEARRQVGDERRAGVAHVRRRRELRRRLVVVLVARAVVARLLRRDEQLDARELAKGAVLLLDGLEPRGDVRFAFVGAAAVKEDALGVDLFSHLREALEALGARAHDLAGLRELRLREHGGLGRDDACRSRGASKPAATRRRRGRSAAAARQMGVLLALQRPGRALSRARQDACVLLALRRRESPHYARATRRRPRRRRRSRRRRRARGRRRARRRRAWPRGARRSGPRPGRRAP